ncbi:tenascin-R-like [Lytechinus variegatus]|uniref:tenascin-R-like n=1 Tax=Lytechinus variegatus TaxID=7654 RepID=UPI001BB29B8D|nr:tenascin-R-like [Lytechinus variegatus]
MFCPTSACQPGCRLFPLALMLLLLRASSLGSGIDSISVETSPTSINISWVISSGSSWDYYTLEVIKSSRSLSGYPTNTTGTTHLITGLDPERLFTITVTPWNAEGAGDSLTENATTEAIPEGVILVSDVTSSSAFLQWRAVEGVLFYTIVAEPSDAVGLLGGIFEEEVGLTILLPGTVFNVTLQNGQTLMELASTQIRSAPESPVNISVKEIGTTMATLSWIPPSSSHDAYEFYVINNSTNERLLITTAQRGDVSDNMETLPDLSPATIYLFEVGSVLNPMDSFRLQRSDEDDNPTIYVRTGPEAPLDIVINGITESSIEVTLIPPRSHHDGYEIILSYSTTNQTTYNSTIQMEENVAYNWTSSGLSFSTDYTLVVGTFLNVEGSFPFQRSENNLMKTFKTGSAVALNLHYVLLLITAFLSLLLV